MRFSPGCGCCAIADCANCTGAMPQYFLVTIASECTYLDGVFVLARGSGFDECIWYTEVTHSPGLTTYSYTITAEIVYEGGNYILRVTSEYYEYNPVSPYEQICGNTTIWEYNFGAAKPTCQQANVTATLVSHVAIGELDACCGDTGIGTIPVQAADCGCIYSTHPPDDPWYVTIPSLTGDCESCASYAGTYELQLSATNCKWRYDWFTSHCGEGDTDYIELKVWAVPGTGFAIEVSLVINCDGTMIAHRFYDTFSGNDCAITDYPLPYLDSSGTSCCDAPESVLVSSS